MLHVSLAVRLAGDLVESLGLWRSWGGLLSAFALVLFVLNMARSMAAAGRLRPSVSPLAGQGG
jgi:hypothetical protein